jgi:glycosyltransferase involved in cell wall biosynthesis
VFYLPSANENFGHAIFEAFAHSVPVMISDQTPWRNLASKHAGWDIPLHSPLDFEKACKQALAWDTNTLAKWKRGALDFAHVNYNATQWIQQYKQLFTSNV